MRRRLVDVFFCKWVRSKIVQWLGLVMLHDQFGPCLKCPVMLVDQDIFFFLQIERTSPQIREPRLRISTRKLEPALLVSRKVHFRHQKTLHRLRKHRDFREQLLRVDLVTRSKLFQIRLSMRRNADSNLPRVFSLCSSDRLVLEFFHCVLGRAVSSLLDRTRLDVSLGLLGRVLFSRGFWT